MNHWKLLQHAIGIILVTLFLVGCGTPGIIPKAGHWEGEPSVSFDVTDDGNITNFKIVGRMPLGLNTCTIEVEHIVIESDGTFIVGSQEGLFATYISGNFDTPTTMTGSYEIGSCDGQATAAPYSEVPTWNAEWTES